jgi:hypothetical protein
MNEQALKSYLFEYRHNGSTWGLKIEADSPQDAQARLKSLAWSHYKGEVMLTLPIPGTSHGSLFGRLISCFR